MPRGKNQHKPCRKSDTYIVRYIYQPEYHSTARDAGVICKEVLDGGPSDAKDVGEA